MAGLEKSVKNLRRDPDIQNAKRVLQRAALRARERARQTTGYVVIFRDGKIIHEPVADMDTLADQDALDVMRSRKVEQEVLDLLDEPAT